MAREKSHVCQEERIPMNEINRPLIYSFPIRLLPAPTGLKRFFSKISRDWRWNINDIILETHSQYHDSTSCSLRGLMAKEMISLTNVDFQISMRNINKSSFLEHKLLMSFPWWAPPYLDISRQNIWNPKLRIKMDSCYWWTTANASSISTTRRPFISISYGNHKCRDPTQWWIQFLWIHPKSSNLLQNEWNFEKSASW